MASAGLRVEGRLLLGLVAAMAVVLGVGLGSAQAQGDFDFTDDEDAGGGDFDFTDEVGSGTDTDPGVTIKMPDGSKPIIVAWFDPVDSTDARVINRLTDAMVEHLGEFTDYDVVSGIVIKQELDRMSMDERDGCVNDATCVAALAKKLNITKVVVGRIQTDGVDRPRIYLDLIDVETGALENFIEFESSPTVQGQTRELRPASYKLFNRRLPDAGTNTLTTQSVDRPWIGTGQLVASIATGVVGVALIGTGAAFGVMASDLEAEVEKGRGGTMTQKTAVSKLDEAQTNATIANVMYGVGGVAIAAAVVILLVRPGDEIDETASSAVDFYISPSIGAEGGGLVSGFRF